VCSASTSVAKPAGNQYKPLGSNKNLILTVNSLTKPVNTFKSVNKTREKATKITHCGDSSKFQSKNRINREKINTLNTQIHVWMTTTFSCLVELFFKTVDIPMNTNCVLLAGLVAIIDHLYPIELEIKNTTDAG